MSRRAVLIALAAATMGYLALWSTIVAVPFRWLTTLVHEISHGLMAELMGGEVTAMTINTRGGGLTEYRIAPDTTRRLLVTSAGYLGSAFVGAVLLAVAARRQWAERVLIVFGAVVLITTVLWVPVRSTSPSGVAAEAAGAGSADGPFTWLFVAALAVVFFVLIRYASDLIQELVVIVLAVAISLSSLDDLRSLVGLSLGTSGHSDAVAAEQLTGVSDWFWAAGWSVLAVAGIWVGLSQVLPGGLGLTRRSRS